MEDTKKLAQQLMNDAEKLPPMTEDERNAQRLDFAYGNLAASTHHKPERAAFAKLAFDLGWSSEKFDGWWSNVTSQNK